MSEHPIAEGLALLIAADLERVIYSLGYLVGMGQTLSDEDSMRAARNIVSRVQDKALELLAERASLMEEGGR